MGQTSRRTASPTSDGDPFWALVATARRLQASGGCPWDRKQTIPSLLPYLIEETWEVFETVRSDRLEELEEELGDVLYTVLFIALKAQRSGRCNLSRLLASTRAKMIRRHPHVFGHATARNARHAYEYWARSKREEGQRRYSPPATFRKTLTASWEWLHANPEANARQLRRISRSHRAHEMSQHQRIRRR